MCIKQSCCFRRSSHCCSAPSCDTNLQYTRWLSYLSTSLLIPWCLKLTGHVWYQGVCHQCQAPVATFSIFQPISMLGVMSGCSDVAQVRRWVETVVQNQQAGEQCRQLVGHDSWPVWRTDAQRQVMMVQPWWSDSEQLAPLHKMLASVYIMHA